MKFLAEIVVGFGLGVVPPLADDKPVARPVPCICGQSDECKCESGKCPGGCPVVWTGEYGKAYGAKHAVILFTDPSSCAPCRKLEAGALADKDVKAALRGTVNVRADTSTPDGSRLSNVFGVHAIPTILVYKDGQLTGRVVGNADAGEVLKAITK